MEPTIIKGTDLPIREHLLETSLASSKRIKSPLFEQASWDSFAGRVLFVEAVLEAAELEAVEIAGESLPVEDAIWPISGNEITVTSHSSYRSDAERRMHAMSNILRQLHEVMTSDDYDECYKPPTQAVFDAVWNVIAAAYQDCPVVIPPASVGAIGDGGLSVRWVNGSRDVSLTVPPTGIDAGHIYFAGAESDDLIRPITGENLAVRLEWLAQP